MDRTDYARLYAKDVAVAPPVGGSDNVQDALAAVGGPSIVTTHLDAAALAAMFTAPTTILAAPGVNKLWQPTLIAAQYVPGVTGYQTTGGDNIGMFWGAPGADNRIVAVGIFPDEGFAQIPSYVPEGINGIRHPMAGLADTPLVFGCSTAIVRFGPIAAAVVANGGAGYAVGDTGTVDGTLSNATYLVTAEAAGVVTAFTVTNPGTSYDTVNNPFTTTPGGAQPGGGAGLTVNITAIPPADGDLYLTTFYVPVDLH